MFEIFNTPQFLIGALLLVLLALGFVLPPMLNRGDEARRFKRKRRALEELRDELPPEEYRKRIKSLQKAEWATGDGAPATRGIVPALILIIPLLTLGLYVKYGTPDGLRAQSGESAQLRAELGRLAAQVNRDPQDAQAWSQLGLIWKNLEQYQAAEAAFRRVLFIDGFNTFAAVELAETLLFGSGTARLPAESRMLLDQVANHDPQNQKALWLSGMGALQDGSTARAIALWERLEQLLPEGSVRDQVSRQIDQARQRLAMGDPHGGIFGSDQDGAGNSATVAGPQRSGIAEPGPASVVEIPVRVILGEELADRIQGDETLFVFARAINGPPAPLAVQRHQASDLPLELVLSDRDAMAEGLTLGTFPQVSISARISRSGNAIASDGDLEGRSDAIDVNAPGEVTVIINKRIDR